MSKRSRKRKAEEEEQSMVDWEQENIFPDEVKAEMESMWEIPQVFHFLHLAKDTLNIPHLSMYEMERMLLMPRASKQLANIMTSLLSSSTTKAKLRKIPSMPYEFWTNILAYKMKSWFKVYEAKHRDAVKVLETIGVEPQFWNVFPDAPLLNGKDFEELTFKQKVWLLKTVCDTVMHTRKTVQEEIAKQPWEDQFETVLGTDRHGARYTYFPQFLKTDLRVYRHCLDNEILSTVKPIKPKLKAELETKVQTEQNSLTKKKAKQKRRRSRWSSGMAPRSRRKVIKCGEKNPNKCISDSKADTLKSENTNPCGTSSCSRNDNNNSSTSSNNNISLDTVNGNRTKSLSNCSEVRTKSEKARCNSEMSNGYDMNSSAEATSDSSSPFKGFPNTSDDKCGTEAISGITNDAKSDATEGQGTNDADISLVHTSQGRLESTPTRQYADSVDLCADRGEAIDRAVDNLSSISKTDDEKLNEIISAECLKLNDKGCSNFAVSTASKSDDEKLNETRTSHSTTEEDNSSEGTERSKTLRHNGQCVKEQKPKALISNERKVARPVRFNKNSDDKDAEPRDDKDLSLSELRRMLQKEAMDEDFSFDEDTEAGCNSYNFRKIKNERTDGWKQEVENFNEMLMELSVSRFQLVADSVSSFRDLISTFSEKSDSTTADIDDDNEPISPCEAKLIKNMKNLSASLEGMEPALRDSTKKARGKLQKEWTNFKEGSVEDQDSSGEGLGSNWWVLGSQGCPLPNPGDATLQTIPKSALPAAGSQHASNKIKNQEEPIDRTEHRSYERQDCTEHQGEDAQSEAQRSQSERGDDNSQESTGVEEETKEEDADGDGEHQTRRVLRARGVSSYTEQFYSDDEIEENELEEWTDVEAVYAAPSAQAGAPSPHFGPKVKHADDRTKEEDSDQDWILPGSRKRKNKRPSANRRLKSFQHKLQSIKVDELQEAAESTVAPAPAPAKKEKAKPRIKDVQICKPKKPVEPRAFSANRVAENQEAVVANDPKQATVPSAETTCKVENIESVHSELDIKDEGPIYDTVPGHFDNSYAAGVNPNYVMVKAGQNPMNYYLMQPTPTTVVSQNTIVQPGPVVSGIVPPIHQGYYVQGGQNYIIQNPQSTFVPPQTFQPQGPQMMTPQQFVGHPGYVPYVVARPGFVATDSQVLTQGVSQAPPLTVHSNPSIATRPPHSRHPIPRHGHPHPAGAVIRSSLAIRGNFPRGSNPKTRSLPQQRGTPVRAQRPRSQGAASENASQKTTSVIVVSDSDDDIEMIITEKAGPESEAGKAKSPARKNTSPAVQKATTKAATPKNAISPQIIQRMSQGGISITPVKSAPPVQNPNTQLVVVVNETGSHYALALPNGSKLILTPEQVAQIRASNGGKLIL
ncbi:uncharacterized protein LOC143374055 isoform X2 [Andrena cerasifolii]|uniref:uncharacterized protein LOC143374055 isoform X2 n=1 Tax=Andrena cerasifolii TaxID=2819439 RepID=UPI004037D5FE